MAGCPDFRTGDQGMSRSITRTSFLPALAAHERHRHQAEETP
jgi:hypothetical protein